MKKNKIRDIIIDADHILFFVAESGQYKNGFEKTDDEEDGDDFGVEVDTNIVDKKILKQMKKHFKSILEDYVKTAEVESISYEWTTGETKVILTDTTNFRYDIYPEYKANRKKNFKVNIYLEALKKWARKKYIVEANTEADDVVAYYVRKGGIGFTTDKDLLKGVSGIWYNTHYAHRTWTRTTPEEAEKFFKMQCLAGDGVDGIPALPRVGLPTAEKLMNKFGWGWVDMLKIYEDKGFDKKYFETMVRLVCMSQWTPKKGVKLWEMK